MEGSGRVICAWVNANIEDLNRATISEQFSKFGSVKKIYIEKEGKYAKVYFNDQGCVARACGQLNGYKGWVVKSGEDKYCPKRQVNNNDFGNFNKLPTSEVNSSFGSDGFIDGSYNLPEMDEDCVYAGEYVDIHGRSVEVLQGENGQHFVNLDDVRAAGFNIYPKESFENATITKDIELRHFENFLLNQGKKYILNFKQKFNEDEMLNVFERVRAKLQSAQPVALFGEGRLINNTQSKNFSITTRNNLPTSAGTSNQNANNRSPRQVPENVKPTFGFSNAQRGSQHDKPSFNNTRRPQNNPTNRNMKSGEALWDRTSDRNFVDSENASQIRKPKFQDSRSSTVKLNSVVENNETEKGWEDEATDVVVVSPPKQKPQNDVSASSNERLILNIERVQLESGSTHKLSVCYINPEKNNLIHGQLCENSNLIQEILLHVNTKDLDLPIIEKPVRHMLCVVYFEDCWYRAVVIHERATPGCAYVELIDYGNREDIKTPLREMSDAMKKIPGQAVRCTIDAESLPDGNLEIGHNIEVSVKKHISNEYEDLTHLVRIKNVLKSENVDDEPVSPPGEVTSDVELPKTSTPVLEPVEDCFTEVPPSSAKLIAGESVIVVNYTDNKLVLRNKETAIICKNVYTYLKDMQKKTISDPKVGQLVLCSKDTDEGLHRAVITKINGKAADLEFIDYYGGETLALKSLRNIDKVLASYPSAKIEQNYPVLEQLTEPSDTLLQDLVLKKKKIKTTEVDGKIDFLLTEDDETILLSKKIKDLANPPKVKSEPVTPTVPRKSVEKAPSQTPPPSKPEPATPKQEATPASQVTNEEYANIPFDDMPYVTAQLGLGDYSCYSCKGDSVTLVSLSDENASYIMELDISEPTDKTPHTPELLEMCLAKFKDIWYRALVTEIDGDMFEVLFVDYGNAENVNKTDLRRLPKRLATVPILGINAYFVGIPDTPKVHNRLKELIPDEELFEVDVKVDLNDDQKYGIEIPAVYEILRKEGLI